MASVEILQSTANLGGCVYPALLFFRKKFVVLDQTEPIIQKFPNDVIAQIGCLVLEENMWKIPSMRQSKSKPYLDLCKNAFVDCV